MTESKVPLLALALVFAMVLFSFILKKPDDDSTPLHSAAGKGQIELTKELIAKGADVNSRIIQDLTPLHEAVKEGKIEIVKLLIEKGANVEAKGWLGGTALDVAIANRRPRVVALLLDKGANVNTRDISDGTPLHSAVQMREKKIAALLIERGANLEARNKNGETPLGLPGFYNDIETTSLLINGGASLETKNNKGQTPLFIAASYGNADIVKLLLKKGADVGAKDNDGWTPLYVAQKKGRKEIAALLIQGGATQQMESLIQTTPGRYFTSNHDIEFVWIPPGEFLMGSPFLEAGRSGNEGPVHLVTFKKGFWMSWTEVTQRQWKLVMKTNPSNFQGKNALISYSDGWLGSEMPDYQPPDIENAGGSNPVEQVSFTDCEKYVSKLNEKEATYKYAIPTEAQWEYACRAKSRGPFSYGDNIKADEVNFDGSSPYNGAPKSNSINKTSFGEMSYSNDFGLKNMHGNVREWCRDTWHENYTGAPVDGASWTDRQSLDHVIRGGGWNSSGKDCRSASRSHGAKDYRANNLGLRLVLIEE